MRIPCLILVAVLFLAFAGTISFSAPFTQNQRIKTIVIDPGHGGTETGAKGKFGSLEKDITLAISLKLKEVIERRLAYRVFLTRDKDVDVSVENRSALANNHKADVFISIHVNGAYQKAAQGSETFFLSLNATDEEARRLAYLENNSSRPSQAGRARAAVLPLQPLLAPDSRPRSSGFSRNRRRFSSSVVSSRGDRASASRAAR